MSTYGELWEAFEDAEIAESETTAMACVRAVRERDEARTECERFRAENEKLRRTIAVWKEDQEDDHQRLSEAEDECERLRAELAERNKEIARLKRELEAAAELGYHG